MILASSPLRGNTKQMGDSEGDSITVRRRLRYDGKGSIVLLCLKYILERKGNLFISNAYIVLI